MKTLAQLKRDSAKGNLYLEMVERHGKTDIPSSVLGKRRVIGSNTVSLEVMNNDGKASCLYLPAASLVEYSDTELVIYTAGLRELNKDELAVMAEWEKITETEKYKKQLEYDLLADCSQTFFQEKHFFEDRGFNYLRGYDTEKGCRYDCREKKVRDNKIKGEAILKYRVYKSEGDIK